MSDNAAAPQSDSAPAPAAPESQSHDGQSVVDYGEILARHQGELARTRSDLDRSNEVLTRVQKAFSGDQKELPAHEQRMRDFDDLGSYLDQEALEDQKKGGRGLPITTKIGKQLVTFGKEAEARAAKLERELEDLKAQVKRQQNPAFQGLERAGFIMEGMLDEGLKHLYGADPAAKQVRASQFEAVSRLIHEEMVDLAKNDPDGLLQVQRNPKIQRRMVNHFMAQVLPPKVREMMDNDRLKNEPTTSRDLMQSFAEARQEWQAAQAEGDERKEAYYSSLMDELRPQILMSQQDGQRTRNPDKPSLNQLFGR